MQRARWLATGFVAGLAVAGGAFLLLRDEASREPELARIAELKSQVDRLESAVTKLSMLANAAHTGTATSTQAPTAAAASSTPASKEKDQAQAIAEAEALVDLGLQSGRWTRQQQEDLGAAVTDLDVDEQGRILARVSKAINDGQLKFDPRQ